MAAGGGTGAHRAVEAGGGAALAPPGAAVKKAALLVMAGPGAAVTRLLGAGGAGAFAASAAPDQGRGTRRARTADPSKKRRGSRADRAVPPGVAEPAVEGAVGPGEARRSGLAAASCVW